MRVVSSVPHESVVKQVICKTCGSTLEYVPIDVTSEYVRDYGGGGETQSHVVCPNCNHRVSVKNPTIAGY